MEQINTKEISNDLSINISRKERVKKYFHLTTYRITFLGLALALNLVMAVFSKYVIGLIPIWNFLVVEVTFFTYLIIAFAINTFYSFIMVIICTWIRMPMLNDEWVGLTAMTLADGIQLLLVMMFTYLFFHTIKIQNRYKKAYVVFLISSIIAIIINAALNVFWNYVLTLPLYKKMYGMDLSGVLYEYLGVAFGFNILKYSLNCAIFLALLKALIIISNKY